MADKEMTIMFPEEKMEALEFFMREQNEKMDDMLKAYLEKVYEKNVPLQVRKYVESLADRYRNGEISQGKQWARSCKKRQAIRKTECSRVYTCGRYRKRGRAGICGIAGRK